MESSAVDQMSGTPWESATSGLTERLIARDDHAAVAGARVVHVEAAGRAVVGRERQPEESALAAAQHQARDVEEWRRLQDAVANRGE